jgi:hypothetical protein
VAARCMDEVRPWGRCCHLSIGLPVKETKPGAAVTGPKTIGRATELSLPRSPSLSNYGVPPFGCDMSFVHLLLCRLALKAVSVVQRLVNLSGDPQTVQ